MQVRLNDYSGTTGGGGGVYGQYSCACLVELISFVRMYWVGGCCMTYIYIYI